MQMWDLHGKNGFPLHHQRGRGDDIQGVDVECMIHRIDTNFVCLTHRVTMVQLKEFPEAMQRQVVGVPRAWVRLLIWLTNVIFFYDDDHPIQQA